MVRNPGIKENVFERPGEVFHCFGAYCQYVCRKMTEKLKKRAMCWSLGDFSSMVRKPFTKTLLYSG